MTARRAYPFSQTVAGETAHGILFANEAELDEALRFVFDGAACEAQHQQAQPAIESAGREPRPPGRPPLEAPIGAAVEALGRRALRRCPTLADARRLVQQHIAMTT